MRTGQPITGRPAWYDRNPTTIRKYYNVNAQAPHSDTQQWTYTVPAGRKTFIEYIQAKVRRATAATTAGRPRCTISYAPGGSGLDIFMRAAINSNNVGDCDHIILGQNMVLLPGDIVTGFTGDDSTGGTADYNLNMKIIEFDA